jgi:hypothetical protein
VRPAYRWADIYNEIQRLLKRYEAAPDLQEEARSTIHYHIKYMTFTWLSFRKEFSSMFENLRYNIEVFDEPREGRFVLELTQSSFRLPEIEIIERYLHHYDLEVLLPVPFDTTFERLVAHPSTRELLARLEVHLISSSDIERLAIDLYEEHGISSIIRFLNEYAKNEAPCFLWVIGPRELLPEAKECLLAIYRTICYHNILFAFPNCSAKIGEQQGPNSFACTYLGKPLWARRVPTPELELMHPDVFRKRSAFIAKVYYTCFHNDQYYFVRRRYSTSLSAHLLQHLTEDRQRIDLCSRVISALAWLEGEGLVLAHDLYQNTFFEDNRVIFTEIGFPGKPLPRKA